MGVKLHQASTSPLKVRESSIDLLQFAIIVIKSLRLCMLSRKFASRSLLGGFWQRTGIFFLPSLSSSSYILTSGTHLLWWWWLPWPTGSWLVWRSLKRRSWVGLSGSNRSSGDLWLLSLICSSLLLLICSHLLQALLHSSQDLYLQYQDSKQLSLIYWLRSTMLNCPVRAFFMERRYSGVADGSILGFRIFHSLLSSLIFKALPGVLMCCGQIPDPALGWHLLILARITVESQSCSCAMLSASYKKSLTWP